MMEPYTRHYWTLPPLRSQETSDIPVPLPRSTSMSSDACMYMCNAGTAQDGAGLLGGPAPHTLHPQKSKGTTCGPGRLVVYMYLYMFTGVRNASSSYAYVLLKCTLFRLSAHTLCDPSSCCVGGWEQQGSGGCLGHTAASGRIRRQRHHPKVGKHQT